MKRITLLTIALAGLLTISSCGKDGCKNSNAGIIVVSNNSSNPYDIYIDGFSEGRLSGGKKSKKIKVPAGRKRLHAKQVSGYILYPTEVSHSIDLKECGSYTWQIP